MSRATGLAVRIKEIFGITPKLVEGHNGIYEIGVNGRVIATNNGHRQGTPGEEEILQIIGRHASPLPGKEKLL